MSSIQPVIKGFASTATTANAYRKEKNTHNNNIYNNKITILKQHYVIYEQQKN